MILLAMEKSCSHQETRKHMRKNYLRKTVQYSKPSRIKQQKLNWNERSSLFGGKSHEGICFDHWEYTFFSSLAPVDAFRMKTFGNAMLGTPLHVQVLGNPMRILHHSFWKRCPCQRVSLWNSWNAATAKAFRQSLKFLEKLRVSDFASKF